MKTVSLKKTAADRAEEKKEMTAEYKPPEYDYGTCIDLDGDLAKRLGIDATKVKVGEKMNLTGQAVIKAVSISDREGGKARTRVELQITDLGVEAVSDKTPGEVMYPSMKG